MSPKTRQAISVTFGLLLVAGIGYGVFVAVRATMLVIASLDSSIAVAIIAAAATVLVSVLSIVLGKVYEARSLIQKEHREKKTPVYEDLIKFMFRILMATKTADPPSEKETIEFMAGFTQRIMVWGSDEVLAAWVKWRRLSTDEAAMKANPIKLMLLYEELIFAIRRDLGHKNKGLATGDILALFVNDIDQHLPKKDS
jgi:uncharacterized protein YneF (UPF0154 family)